MGWLTALSVALGIVIFAADLALPNATAGGVPYVLLVLVSLWMPRRRHTWIAATAGTLLLIFAFLLSLSADDASTPLMNRLLVASVLWATAIAGTRLRREGREPAAKGEPFRQITEALPVFVAQIDLQQRIRLLSRSYEKRLGKPRKEFYGKHVQEVVGDQVYANIRAHIEAALSGQEVSFETEFFLKKGEKSSIHATFVPDVEEEGKVRGFSVLVQDITERREAQETLQLIVEGTAQLSGRDFFVALVRHLTRALGVRYAFVAELADAAGTRARTLALCTDDETQENFEYELAGTPCENVVGRKMCFYPDRVRELFPRDKWLAEMGAESYLGIPFFDSSGRAIGHMGVLHDQPMDSDLSANSILKVFAARTGAELERVGAEHALRESEVRFKTLFESAPDAYYLNDLNGTFLDGNRASEALTGYPREELIGQNFLSINLLPPDDIRRAANFMERSARGEATGPDELTLNRKDGSQVPIEIRTYPVRIKDQTVVLGIARDISERKRVEEALRESEALYRDLIENIEEMVCTHDLAGNFLTVNQPLVRQMGYEKAEDFLGRNLSEYLAPDARHLFRPYLRTIIEEGRAEGVMKVQTRSGEIRFLEYRNTLRREGNEKPIVRGVSRDVTRRLKAEAALNRLRRQNELILNTAGEGIYGLDLEGNTTFVNPAAARMIGWETEELIGKSQHAVLHHTKSDGSPYPREECLIYAAFKDGTIHHVDDEVFWRKDGSSFPVEYISTPIRGGRGKLLGAVVTFRDITERKRTERDLRRTTAFVQLLQAVTVAANEASTMEEALQVCLDQVCVHTGWRVGHVYIPSEDSNGNLIPTTIWHLNEPSRFETFRKVTEVTPFEPGIGLPGRVLASGKPAWIVDVTQDPNFPRARLAQDIGVRGAFAFPVLIGSEVVAVLEFFTPNTAEPDEQLMRVIAHMGMEVGRAIERRRAEKDLLAARARLEHLLSSSPAVIYSCKPSGDFGATFISGNVTTQMGYEPQDFINNSGFWAEHIHPDDAQRIFAGMPKLFEQGQHSHEYRFLHKDGTYRWMYDELELVQDAEGNSREIVGSWIDITQRKIVEEALQRSEKQFRTLIESAPNGVLLANQKGRIVLVNPQMEKLFGYSREELMGEPVEMLMPERYRSGHVADRLGFTRQPSPRSMGRGVELYGRRKDGSEFPLEISLGPIESEEGLQVAAIISDITERKQAEEAIAQRSEELAAANRELESFSYSVSHDLRAPLRHIDGFTNILMEELGPKLDSESRRYLGYIRDGTRQMGELVDDLLRLSRVGRQDINRQRTDLNGLVESVVSELGRETKDRQIDWQLDSLPPLECDSALMRHVFMNFLSNAVKFTRPRRRAKIQVGQKKVDGGLAIFVRDNGVGFNMKYVDKVFGVFQRLHRVEEFEGTGIGLAIVQRVIHKHGGRVWAEAKPGKGATFYFTLELPKTRESKSKQNLQ